MCSKLSHIKRFQNKPLHSSETNQNGINTVMVDFKMFNCVFFNTLITKGDEVCLCCGKLIVLGFNNIVNPCGSFCVVSQRKGEEIEEIVEEMKERERDERGTGMKVKKQKK